MRFSESSGIDVYRVRQSTTHPKRHVRKAWYGRTWQAEWPDCVWAVRAYTRRGALRKAKRWSQRNMEANFRRADRHRWWRKHVTRRAEYRTPS